MPAPAAYVEYSAGPFELRVSRVDVEGKDRLEELFQPLSSLFELLVCVVVIGIEIDQFALGWHRIQVHQSALIALADVELAFYSIMAVVSTVEQRVRHRSAQDTWFIISCE